MAVTDVRRREDPTAGIRSKRTELRLTVDEELRIPPPLWRVPGSTSEVRVEKCLERIALVQSPRIPPKWS